MVWWRVLCAWAATCSTALPCPAAQSARAHAHDGERVFIRACLDCHTASGGSGLDLTAPGVLQRRALTAAKVVRDGTMPPWLPNSHGASLRDARALTASDRAALMQWLESGAAQTVASVPSAVSQDSPAVLTVRLAEGWRVPADPGLAVRSFALTPEIDQATLVGGFELVADAPGVLHGVSFLWDQLGYGIRLDNSESAPGYDAVGDIGLNASGSAGAISRLAPRVTLPREYAIEIPMRAALIVEAHAQGRGKVESPAATIRFLPAPPNARVLRPLSMHRALCATLADASEAVAISVRAGPRVQSIEVVAIDLRGSTVRLLEIPRWNEQFAEPWFFDPPVALCAGTRLEVRSTVNPAAELVPLDAHATAMSEPTVIVLVADEPTPESHKKPN